MKLSTPSRELGTTISTSIPRSLFINSRYPPPPPACAPPPLNFSSSVSKKYSRLILAFNETWPHSSIRQSQMSSAHRGPCLRAKVETFWIEVREEVSRERRERNCILTWEWEEGALEGADRIRGLADLTSNGSIVIEYRAGLVKPKEQASSPVPLSLGPHSAQQFSTTVQSLRIHSRCLIHQGRRF